MSVTSVLNLSKSVQLSCFKTHTHTHTAAASVAEAKSQQWFGGYGGGHFPPFNNISSEGQQFSPPSAGHEPT